MSEPGPDLAMPSAPQSPASVPAVDAGQSSGAIVWHRDHLRVTDHPAVAAAGEYDRLLPLFVFDPAFYGPEGLACDSRIGFLHDCLVDLNDQYHTAIGTGLTYAHGDPVAILERFREAGWKILAAATPSGRHGRNRDQRAAEQCGVIFVNGDGLVRDDERPREGWSDQLEQWLTADPFEWDPAAVTGASVDTGVTLSGIESEYDIDPSKAKVPDGGTREAWATLESFVDRIGAYPGNISSPIDARGGTSGLSPYLKFGCLSVRKVYQYVKEQAPDGRGKDMFVSRLFWNKHYQQKLQDWPGWLDNAVNPALEGFNADRHDRGLVAAWKHGQTGYPMVDASMRCLRETGWLNFRMRAMCVSFYYHILQQPWQIGADWFHHHLVDSVAGINYTQWQYQCGLVGKPSLMQYNPRKQVRDQDPEGEFVTEWVPELEPLPVAHLDQPEQTPVHVQESCGVRIGEDYPRPVVDYDRATAEFERRYGAVQSDAAEALGDPEVARRASLSGGIEAARAIARKHGSDDGGSGGSQASLDGFGE